MVPSGLILHERQALVLGHIGDHGARFVFLHCGQNGKQSRMVLAINHLHIPAKSPETVIQRGHRHRFFSSGALLLAVTVDDDGQVAQFAVPGQSGSLTI